MPCREGRLERQVGAALTYGWRLNGHFDDGTLTITSRFGPMKAHVISAIFMRNLKSYFSNPTGYVFICVFVLLCTFAAFWPHDFFNANLANFDQLNIYLPYILLIFIPAITMSIWADERRQGTDELLLTIPASDLDVVFGKFLAAVAIYSVSLGFSVYNVLCLMWWAGGFGHVDLGLIAGNYFGYWLVGVAMLSVGMVASFLTSNLTVGFILGVLFNAPLVFASAIDSIPWMPNSLALAIKNLSISEQFRDFGRGVVSFTNILYFALVTAVMLYLSLVLIGRRHWFGGRDGHSMLWHFVVRSLALAVASVGLLVICNNTPNLAGSSLDVTAEGLSTLSPQTKKLLRDLKPEHQVTIDAYVSPTVPENYVPTRLNLLSTLREFERLGRGKVDVHVHPTEPLSDEAQYAEQQFNIKSQQVVNRSRGMVKGEEIFLGVAFTSGLNKVVVPFFDRGVPVEYELLRSVATVAQQKRKKVGVLTTDAKMFGSFDMQRMAPGADQLLVDEIKKQYEVVQVSADSPITQTFDVLLAVQPSSLSPEQMPNFINAVKSGQPTAIFEDPAPMWFDVAGTFNPKTPGGMNPFMMQPPQPKGDIKPLWTVLGIDFAPNNDIVWQDYNPYPKLDIFNRIKEFVVIGAGSGAKQPFNPDDAVTSELQELIFPAGSAVRRKEASELTFTPLATTSLVSGTTPARTLAPENRQNLMRRLELDRVKAGDAYILAARIRGKLKADPLGEVKDDQEAKTVDVIVVGDIDVLSSAFFQIRQQSAETEDLDLNPDNVPFVLNILDSLAGDDRFIDVRKRRRHHRTLQRIENEIAAAKTTAAENRKKYEEQFKEDVAKEEMAFQDKLQEIREDKTLGPLDKARMVALSQEAGQKRLLAKKEKSERQKDAEFRQIERNLDRNIRQLQGTQRGIATAVAPLLPLFLGLVMFIQMRRREKEGVPQSRIR